ncbi:MAG: DUF2520 domain-containing protein [Prevotellaceae bacterium]|jgi:predicted short-subunit dehydrogenase-like oxidoreductase (DUF2520 family)|nr:DUF2520 domain-containing protein [Prevotellaceae bacterium]
MDSRAVKRIACIGSGNLASSLLPALHNAGYEIVQVCSRNSQTAQLLAQAVEAAYTDTLAKLDPDADLYIIAVPDNAIETVLSKAAFGSGMVVHTSGSTPMSVFEGRGVARYGVLYPLQTFTRQRRVSFEQIPLYVEAGSEQDLANLMLVAHKLSVNVHKAASEERMKLHIAAVFTCNFSNHLLAIASRLLRDSGLSFNALKPLIRETFERAMQVDEPDTVQTGPAARGDDKIVSRHVEALSDYPLIRQIYSLISESIGLNTIVRKPENINIEN